MTGGGRGGARMPRRSVLGRPAAARHGGAASAGAAGTAPASALLQAAGLRVGFRAAGGAGVTRVVHGIDLTLRPGECLALVGRSGSGKSVTARSLLGLTGPGAVVEADMLRLGDLDLRALTPREWRRVRGARIGLVLQDALTSLDPLRTVGREIDDAVRLHTRLKPAERRRRVLAALADAGIDDPALRAGQRAGQLSGGLRQRALIAAAIVLRPALLIADEPTTALDRAVRERIVDTLGLLRRDGTALLLITHDLALAARIADRVAVLHEGRIVEEGTPAKILAHPAAAATRRLVRALPDGRPRGTRLSAVRAAGGSALARPEPGPADAGGTALAGPALAWHDVSLTHRTPHGRHRVLDAVSLALAAGHTLGLVGASGSGKTSLARIALGLTTPDSGTVSLFGTPWVPLPEAQRRPRRKLLGAVYQDALSSFDPRHTVGTLLADAVSGGRSRSLRLHAERSTELLRTVGLRPELLRRRPRDLSGGQRQRVAIARALAAGPRVLLCDEPVSGLDAYTQAKVLDTLDDVQEQLGLALLFISHDLGVIRHVSDEVALLAQGRIVAQGRADAVLEGYAAREPSRH